jgi:hypothetical protein
LYGIPERIARRFEVEDLASVQVGAGHVILSTLTLLPNLATDETSSVVAKKLFLNLLQA